MQRIIVVMCENSWNATYHCCDVRRIAGMQHVIFVMFGELLEHNKSLLGCLKNCWNATFHCWDVWRITGMQHVIV